MFVRSFALLSFLFCIWGLTSAAAQVTDNAIRLSNALVRASSSAIVQDVAAGVETRLSDKNPLVRALPQSQRDELARYTGVFRELFGYALARESGSRIVGEISPELQVMIEESANLEVSEFLPAWAVETSLSAMIAEELSWTIVPEHMGAIADFVESDAGSRLTNQLMQELRSGLETDVDAIPSGEMVEITGFFETPAGQSYSDNAERMLVVVSRQVDWRVDMAALPLVRVFLSRACELQRIECAFPPARLDLVAPSRQ